MARVTKASLELENTVLNQRLDHSEQQNAYLTRRRRNLESILKRANEADAMLMDDLHGLALDAPTPVVSEVAANCGSRMRWLTIGVGLGIAALSMVGCGRVNPVAPTSDLVPLDVRVFEYQTATPLAGARVEVTNAGQGCTTDASGVCVAQVKPGVDVTVAASAAGHQEMAASGVVNSRERWTFFLPEAR